MYELSRVRLYSVGPNPARYQDVILDLRHAGAPVTKPAVAATLFDTTATVVRRPSPASVLFAENGNGKTVLVKLIFSVMLPGRKQIVGTSNTKALDGFVLADDVSHVALEWMHVETGQLVVTGKTSAWREHRVSQDSNRLQEAWYSFRPTPEFGLDDLPFTEQGRLVEMSGFRDRLTEADATQPHLQMAWVTGHREWTERLDNLGLDSELFAYQRRMNAGEGEAADAFSFKSDEAFVDWLLTSVIDKDGPRAMAEVIDSYATRLAERDDVVAERDFVAGALERLTPLAAAARDYAAARDLQAEAARDATRLATALVLRRHDEDAKLATLVAEQETVTAQQAAADREQRRLVDIVRELRRLVAELRLNEAKADADRLAGDRKSAQATLAAWQATDLLLRWRDLHEQANAIRDTIREQEKEAEEPLAARNAAAQRLVHGLIAAANTAAAAAETAETEAAALDTQIGEVTREETEHHKAAERYAGEVKATQDRINEAQARIDQAVTDGLLPAGADLTSAATNASATWATAREAVTAAEAEAKALVGERKAADIALRNATKEAAASDRAAADAARRHQQARTVTDTLAAEPRLAALLGASEIVLDTDASALAERLTDALVEADTERDRLRDADREDQRILDALGTGGLLPPPVEVTTVRTTLSDAGIPCYTGWEYLAQMPEDERDTVLSLYPHLVDGVVLNNPAHAQRAKAILDDARLLPLAAVAVGDTTAFADLTGPRPAGLTFLVPPNPALYDEDLAATERDRLLAAHTARSSRLDALARQMDADRALHLRVTDWTQTYPTGTLAALAEAEQDTADAARLDAEEQDRAQTALDAVLEREDALRDTLPGRRTHAEETRQIAERLTALAAEQERIPGWADKVRVARDNQTNAERTAAAKNAEAARLRTMREERIRLADDHKRIAAAHRHEITETFGAGLPDLTGDVPTEPIETLKAIYRAAKEAYEKVQVGADLKAELASAERAESEATGAVENVPTPVRDEAKALLASPDGGDVPARAAATARAKRRLDDLDRAVQEASDRVGQLRARFEDIEPQSILLDPYGRPTSIAHGEELIARADADRATAYARLNEVSTRLTQINATRAATSTAAEGFNSLVTSMGTSAPDEDDIDPDTSAAYAGTLEDARAATRGVLADLTSASEFRDRALAETRTTSSELHQYAGNRRFESVNSPVRDQILNVNVEQLYEHGPDWEDALKPRLRSLQDELAQIDRHRNSIVATLRGHVDTALRTLKAAERVSTLPDALGDWAGQHFLRIRFTDPDPVVLNERLATVVDTITTDKTGKRDGVSIVLKGVRAAVPKVKVEMLKPDATLRTERVRINEVADVFSGGQLLTAAIILYCTMAALRANDRGRVRNSHAGVLFLDNPIGRASAGYLLELQLGVAEALGVQLVYTTGLFDTNALSVFPLIIRLRNDQDVRSGKKYLTVNDTIRSNLDALGDPDNTGKITATRLFRKPATPVTAP